MTLLFETTVKLSVVLVVALAACAILRRGSAALRHWLLAAALVCAAAMPLLQLSVPRWQLSRTGLPPPIAAVAASDAQPAVAPAALPPSASLRSANTPRIAPATPAAWRPTLAIVWLAGVMLCISALAVALGRLARLAARAPLIERGPWRQLCDDVSKQYGIERRVALLQSDHPTLLVTWGVLMPKIILPAGAGEWPRDRAHIVLCHELAHVRRGDWVVQLASELLRSAYWFNPIVWIACNVLRRESELACDDLVLRAGVAGPDYASHLLALARSLRTPRAWLLAPGIAAPSFFERRITAMLNSDVNRNPLPRIGRLATAAALIVLSIGIASAQTSFARISGVVTDQMGAILPDVAVKLTHTATGTKHEVRTNSSGSYDLIGLESGEYALEAEQLGFAGYRETLTVSPGQLLARNIVLQIGSLQETITVVDSDTPGAVRRASSRPPFLTGQRCQPPAIGGNIRVPVKLVDVRPQYPANLHGSGTEGIVELAARVGTDGTMRDVRVVWSPNIDMASAAVDGVRQWEYSQTLLNCAPVDVPMSVLVYFKATR